MKAGQHSYDHLKERLAALFPEAMKTADNNNNLHLHYTDSDGDQITVSTDTEFQEALAELPAQAVWKLHIPHLLGGNQSQKRLEPQRNATPKRNGTPLRLLFQPSYVPSRLRRSRIRFDPWNGMRRFHYSPWICSPFSSLDSWFQDSMLSTIEQEIEDAIVHHHEEVLTSLKDGGLTRDRAEDEGSSSEDQSDKENEEGKTKVAIATDSTVPGLQVKNFGSWEPRECEGQFGRGTVTGPVGYYVSWTSGTSKEQENSKSKKEEGSTEEKTAGGEDKSRNTQNKMETEGEKTAGGEDESGHTQENNMETEGEKNSS